MKPLAIVGLDPGTTSAYAVLGMDGRVIKISSGKETSLAETIAQVIEFCQPVIVSTDKAKIPAFVEEFARKFGAVLAAPEKDLLREEKRMLVLDLLKEDPSCNHHQHDSLAAALFAFKKFLPKLEKADRFIQENGLQAQKEEFFKIALKESLNFLQIKGLLTSPTAENKIIRQVVSEERITKSDFLDLHRKLQQALLQVLKLEKQAARLREKASSARKNSRRAERRTTSFYGKLDALLKFKDERIRTQSQEIKQQQALLEISRIHSLELKKFIGSLAGHKLVKKLPTLSQKDFAERNCFLQIKDQDLVWVDHPEIYSLRVLEELEKSNALLLMEKKPKLPGELRTISFSKPEFLAETDYFALVSPELVEKKLGQNDFTEIIQEYQKKRERLWREKQD